MLSLWSYRKEKILFLSQGNVPFWLFVTLFAKNYSVCIISAQYFEKGIFKGLFLRVVEKAKHVIFTNSYHKDQFYRSGLVVHDRIYSVAERNMNFDQKTIKVLGHINDQRNPIKLVRSTNGNFHFYLKGKVDAGVLAELSSSDNITFTNEYLSDAQYQAEIGVGLIYVPVSRQYSDYFISGVLFDIIGSGGIPLIDFHPLYEELIDNELCYSTSDFLEKSQKISGLDESAHQYFKGLNKLTYNNISKIKEEWILS